MPGSLALILHAHLPFVRHPEAREFLEENWLFEAITETYIPLLNMMERLVADAVPFKITMSITPPLCAMLQDELLLSRYVQHLDRCIDLAQREIERNRDDEPRQHLSRFYLEMFATTKRQFDRNWQRDLLARFRHFRDLGVLEIAASAATHGLLPLLAQPPEAVRAQVMIGCDVYRRAFHAESAGFWLPECAYSHELQTVLQNANIRWFVVDSHALLLGKPQPQHVIYAPCFTPAGPAAFARDPESSRQVWSAESGYPGDPAYREFYRDVGFDLPADEVFANSRDRTPRFTGLKYHRITGGEARKELYDPDEAARVADAHATHFLECRSEQFRELNALGFDSIVTIPFDAELFGHWWFEGPQFLEAVVRKAAAHRDEFQLSTPSDFLMSHPTHEVVEPAASSWGEGGYWAVWLDESNAWIYPHLHAMAQRMTELARTHAAELPTPITERALQQLARELLLAQASDWAFLMRSGTAREYATKRTNEHVTRFNKLCEQLRAGSVDVAFLSDCEWRDNLFAELNWRHYLTPVASTS